MSTYQPSIPTGTVDLDVDYLNIQGNFQQLDTSFDVDHVTFSNQTPQNGYHKSIRFNPISTTVTNPPNNQPVVPPTTVANYGQLFSSQINDGINTDTAFYLLTGGGRLTQLTRNFQPTAGNNGYTFLPGGLIMQWGRVTGLSGAWPTNPQVVTLNVSNINFSTNNYAVFTTFIGPTSGTSGDISINSLTTSTFTWQFSGSSNASFDGFYWWAIGR